MSATGYPEDHLTEVELVEIASALTYHFDRCTMPDDEPPWGPERHMEYEIMVTIVTRIIRRRAGLLPERTIR